MRTSYFLTILLGIAACNSIQQNTKTRTLKIKGSESMFDTFSTLISDFERLQDTIDVELEGGGSRTGLMAIKEKTAHIGLSSFPFNLDSILGANHSVSQREVAFDGIVVVNHLDNPVQKLSDDQIFNIYTGVVRDWSEIGGNPGLILPIVRDSNSGTQKFFEEHFKISQISNEVLVAEENHEIVDSIVSNENSIGFIGYAYYTAMVKNVELPASGSADAERFVAPEPRFISNGEYPLKRALRIYFQNDYDPTVIAFLTYLDTDRARSIIESHGLIVI